MMIKNFFKNLAIITVCFSLFAAPLAFASANSQIFGACGANSAVGSSPVCKTDQSPAKNPIISKINVAADIIAAVAGIAAVIMAIISGLTMTSSAGSPEAVANAKKQLTYAIVGIVIIALAWAITRFVVDVVL